MLIVGEYDCPNLFSWPRAFWILAGIVVLCSAGCLWAGRHRDAEGKAELLSGAMVMILCVTLFIMLLVIGGGYTDTVPCYRGGPP